jgi:hypothetical protein
MATDGQDLPATADESEHVGAGVDLLPTWIPVVRGEED